METEKKIKYMLDELNGYSEYMKCYEDYTAEGHTELANIFHAMAQDELKHAKWLYMHYPELKNLVDTVQLIYDK